MIFDHVVVDGELQAVDGPQISLFNSAYYASYGIYESVKVDAGRPFYLEEHLHRLHKSAAMINLPLKVSVDRLLDWFNLLRDTDPQATWSLKVLVIGPEGKDDESIVALQPLPLSTYPPEFYVTGASAVLFEGQRFMPVCKSLNTLVNTLARRAATEAGALEGLLHHDSLLTEGSRTNLFVVRDGELLTPRTGDVLSGITREVIIDVMAESDHPVVEADVPADPSQFDEVFISSTSMHVMPITRIDGQPVGDGGIGPITKVAMKRFNEFYDAYMSNTSR